MNTEMQPAGAGLLERRVRPRPDDDDITDALSKALRRAYSLGQTYWQQADSDSYAQNLRSDETQRKFDALVDETRDALFAHCKEVSDGERHACSIAVWMTKMDATADDADDKGVAGWLDEAEARVKRRGAKTPCGECHLQPGERCDVCGASSGA